MKLLSENTGLKYCNFSNTFSPTKLALKWRECYLLKYGPHKQT